MPEPMASVAFNLTTPIVASSIVCVIVVTVLVVVAVVRTRPRVLMKPAPSVCQSVCQSDKVLILPTIRFFLIFCIKLAFNISRKVTKPDFRKKMSWSKFGPKLGPK